MATELKGVWETKSAKTGMTASYKIGGKEVIKITNLNPNLEVNENDGTIAGVTVTEDSTGNKVTLSASALNGATVAFTSTYYALEIDDDVPTVGFEDITETVTNGTATFKGTIKAGYTLAANGKSLTYSAAKSDQVLATVSGLATTAEADNVILNEDAGTITLDGAALNAKKASLALKNGAAYTLAIDDDVDKIKTTAGTWTFASNKATLKGTVDTAGYAVAPDGKAVNYIAATKAGSTATLVTISGLAADCTEDAVSDSVDENGNYVITLPADSLGTKAVSLSGNGYAFALESDVYTSENAPTHDEWSVSGTTATYKQIMPAHYDVVGTKVNYTAEAATQTYATVTNLVSELQPSADKQSLLSGSTEVVTIEDNVIKVGAGALNKKTVALTSTAYTLAPDEDVEAPQVNTNVNAAWTVSKTSAVYKGGTTEGYSDTNDWTITYVAAKSGATLATVDNLASGLNAANLNNSESEYYIAVDNDEGTITLPAAVLASKTVTVTPGDGFKYTLALGEGIADSPEAGYTWEVTDTTDGNTATAKLYLGTADYYTGAGTTTLKYNDAVQGSSVATIQNLKAGITADDLPVATDIKKVQPKDKSITIPLTSAALTNKTVILNGTGYMLALTEDLSAKSGKTIWKLDDVKGSNPTATLSNYTTEGWAANPGGTQIQYTAPVTGATIATLEGFKSGLQLTDDKTEFTSGIVVGNGDNGYEAGKIAIKKAAVGSGKITLTSSTYKLVVGDDLTESEAERKWTTDSKGAAVYTYTTPQGYSIGDGGKTFSATKKTTVTATITGLGTNPTDITELAPDDENHIITLSKGFLGTDDVTIKGAYTLAIDSSVKAPVVGNNTWDMSKKGTAVLKGQITTAGYTQTNGTTITYTAPTDTSNQILATISGLNTTANQTDTTGLSVGDDNVITLSSNVLNKAKVTIKSDSYTLALNEDDEDLPLESKDVTEWVVSGTTANYQTYTKGYYAMEKTKAGAETGAIIYNKDGKATTLATVKGLAKGATIDTDEDYDDETKTLTLNADQLGTSNVTLTGTGYSLALGDDVQNTKKEVTEWVNSGTKATYQTYDKAYYTLSGTSTGITYSKPGKATVHLTLNGITSGSEVTDANLNTSKRTITLNADQLNHKSNKAATKLTTSKEADYTDYKIVLANGTSEPDSDDATWTVTNGKATYNQPIKEGNYVNDGTTVTYYNADTTATLATISGLNKTSVTTNSFADVEVKDGVITLTSSVLQTDSANASTKVTVSKGYTLALASNVATPDDATTPEWDLSTVKTKGTATYNNAVPAGYAVDTKGTTINYSAAKTTNTLATLSGLNKVSGYEDAADAGFSVNDETGVITLSNADLLSSKVSVKGTGYTLAVDEDLAPKKIEDTSEAVWTLKGTTATLNLGTTSGYVADAKKTSVSLAKQVADTPIAELSGLGKNVKVDTDGKLGTIDSTTKQFVEGVFIRSDDSIALTPAVLGTTDVKLTNKDGYAFTIADENFTEPDIGEMVWNYDATKGTATLYQTTTEGWTLKDDNTTLKYTAGKDNAALTTISGLSKTFTGTLDEVINTPESTDDTLTIEDAKLLSTGTATIKNATGYTYQLALGDDIPQTNDLQEKQWLTSGAKATLKDYNQAYYKINDKGAIVYNKAVDVKGKVYAEVSGIKKDVDISDCVSGDVITLNAAQLDNKNVTVTNKTVGDDISHFTLALGSDVTIATPDTTATWVTGTGTTANLTASVSAGFTASSDGSKLTYTKDQPKAVLAVIKGVNKGALDGVTLNTASNSILVDSSNLSNNVTVDGKETYGFKFDTEYSGKITGAATADTINAAGDNVTIAAGAGNDNIIVIGTGASVNGGKGNDTIRSGSGNNTFYYATGDGDDVIANFVQASDKIMTNASAVKVEKSGSNAVITIGEGTKNEGTITLTGKGSAVSSISVVNTKDVQLNSKYAASSDVLLADDNYSMNAAALTDITDAFHASYTPYDFESGLDLVKKDSFTPVVSYTGDDK